MTTPTEGAIEAAYQRLDPIGDGWAMGDGLTIEEVVRALADAGLLWPEMREEWVTTDLMGEPEEWRGTFSSREEAELFSDACCSQAPMRRYVTNWGKVDDDTN
ncbi:hypothetical protein EF847_01415 [Actinobacteria bacterium YIM 96077]|uniref:Uncharacterized protein n=1 Tax=Phytoactinopolyspora halophila TaxID=1981511 RepID=A0A329QFX1_9ACTN|nr:hypothetical protein [Phytoactinopolyspora halophila]AYY11580.1 hypothetical protein EF847_01415 [Actinobacteria bacterium YIM 96077]RAW11126.1 hypothetical protein DPM12_17440 [Phytoactinopolyspora halophila]